ncbi:MAG: hypothetical protein HYX65_07420 [Gemmatimonadetes bacterium]|nr:hypothetical protein [Gemmatimonadota bacterium]
MIVRLRLHRPFACLALLLVAVLARGARAQTAEDNIQAAIKSYENLEVATALRTFSQVVSPTSPFPVTEAQRVMAFKYMGAAYASLGNPDSARIFFQGAILRDPFTDLDPNKFTDRERGAFAEAKRTVFKLNALISRDSIAAGSGHAFLIRTVTSHAGRLVVSVQRNDSAGRPIVLFSSDGVDGPRDVTWNGTVAGRAVDPGAYDLIISGESQDNLSAGKKDSTRIGFEIRWLHEPLETELRALKPDELLPTRTSASGPWIDLGKGVAVAGVAFILPTALGNASKTDATVGNAAVAAGLGAAVGLWSFIQRTNDRSIPENVNENNRRRAAWQAVNDERAARNQARLDAKTILLVPSAGGSAR